MGIIDKISKIFNSSNKSESTYAEELEKLKDKTDTDIENSIKEKVMQPKKVLVEDVLLREKILYETKQNYENFIEKQCTGKINTFIEDTNKFFNTFSYRYKNERYDASIFKYSTIGGDTNFYICMNDSYITCKMYYSNDEFIFFRKGYFGEIMLKKNNVNLLEVINQFENLSIVEPRNNIFGTLRGDRINTIKTLILLLPKIKEDIENDYNKYLEKRYEDTIEEIEYLNYDMNIMN